MLRRLIFRTMEASGLWCRAYSMGLRVYGPGRRVWSLGYGISVETGKGVGLEGGRKSRARVVAFQVLCLGFTSPRTRIRQPNLLAAQAVLGGTWDTY